MGNKSSLMLQEEEVRQISEDTGFTPSEIEKLYARFSLLDRENCGTLSKNNLLSIPELAINPLCDRILQIIFSDCDEEERINFRQFTRVLATFRSNNTNLSIKGHNTSNDSCRLTGYDKVRQRNLAVSSIFSGNRRQHRISDIGLVNEPNLNNRNNDQYSTGGISESMRKKLSFVFKVYDADNDGRISLNDIKSILKMMVGNFIEDFQLEKIAERVFAELDEDNDGFIEFGDFCKVFSAKDFNNKLRVKFVS